MAFSENTNGNDGTRIYRLHSRRRPCDQCRSRKIRCQADDGQPPCRRCAQLQTACTFEDGRSRMSQRIRTASPSTATPSRSTTRASRTGAQNYNNSPNTETMTNNGTQSLGAPRSVSLHEEELTYHEAPVLESVTATSQLQFSQTLDDLHGQTAILLGASSESDPWLLRHCQFDEYGVKGFYGLHFRNVGGVPNRQKIPVHFIVTPNSSTEAGVAETQLVETSLLRAKLNELIPVTWGIRLIKLFYKYIYPMMPIISSSYFSQDLLADSSTAHYALDHVPCHLLGAIYGLAIPFARNDEHLSIVEMYSQLPCEAVWRIVYESLQEQLHRPRLSVLQAGLFYLHKTSQRNQAFVTAPDAFKWSWLGSLVGVAHNLGLHLETRMCAIPAEEKQIRIRLWWAIYIEDKWLSLLMGRPPYICAAEWDAGELVESDFTIPPTVPLADILHADLTGPFRDMARLSTIADTVQFSFYSLKAAQRLSKDLPLSLQTAQPIFEQLSSWRASVLAPEPPWITSNNDIPNDHSLYPATIHIAHATLVTYIWRALLRPIVPSAAPPLIVDGQQAGGESLDVDAQSQAFQLEVESLCWDLPDLSHLELPLASPTNSDGSHDLIILDLHQSSLTWATSLASLIKHLSPARFHEFWYSWSNACFGVMSSFAIAILIQSPTLEAAVKSKEMLLGWRHIVQNQSKVSPLLLLALARMNGYFSAGLSDVFSLPPQVQAVI